MSIVALVIGAAWVFMSTIVLVTGDSPLAVDDLIRFYGMHCIGHIWLGVSMVLAALRR
jgi:hypothetical protein